MNEVLVFPQITKRKLNNSSPGREYKKNSYKNSYLQHLFDRKLSLSPIRDSLANNNNSNSIKRSKLPPLVKPAPTTFSDPMIQENYKEIRALF